MDTLFSPAVVDKIGTILLYTLVVLFAMKIFVPPRIQSHLRELFSAPVDWFHRHIA